MISARNMAVETVKPVLKKNEEDISEEIIIKEILDGDSNRFEVLVNKYRALLFAIISKHVPYDMVEEVAQDAFIRIYQSLNGFQGVGTFKSWITKITYRTCYDFWRTNYRKKEQPLEPLYEKQKQWLDSITLAQSQEEFERLTEQREAKEILDMALDHLSAEDRMVVTLLHLEEHSVKETADILGWSHANVKIRAFRSRKKLLKIIKSMK